MVLQITENKKNSSKQKWKNREYYVQHDKYVKHQEVKFYCAKKQFPELNFVGTHNKPYGVYGLGKNYHMHFYTKLGHGRYEICRIPCEFTLFTYCLDHPWVPGLPAQEQPRYKPIKDCTYWSVSDSFKNWNIFKLSHKATSS